MGAYTCRDRSAISGGGPPGKAGERQRLPRCVRTRGRCLDLALPGSGRATGAFRRQWGSRARLLSREVAGLPILLPMGAASNRRLAEGTGSGGHHVSGHGGRLVLTERGCAEIGELISVMSRPVA